MCVSATWGLLWNAVAVDGRAEAARIKFAEYYNYADCRESWVG